MEIRVRYIFQTAVLTILLVVLSKCRLNELIEEAHVITTTPTNITPWAATVGGNVIDHGTGISSFGSVWSTSGTITSPGTITQG